MVQLSPFFLNAFKKCDLAKWGNLTFFKGKLKVNLTWSKKIHNLWLRWDNQKKLRSGLFRCSWKSMRSIDYVTYLYRVQKILQSWNSRKNFGFKKIILFRVKKTSQKCQKWALRPIPLLAVFLLYFLLTSKYEFVHLVLSTRCTY